jgi:uncharacterized protein (TIGR02217 family)
MTNFSETLLDLGYDYGTVATLNFKTTITETSDGSEQRMAIWDQPLLSFEVGQQDLDNDELAYLQGFFDARRGSLEGFLFRDWSDYQVISQLLGVANGSVNQFQMYKSYRIEDAIVNRAITKPREGTLKIYLNEVEMTSGYVCDFTRGIVTFESPPTGNLTCDFEFDVPVRFVQDRIDYRFNAIEAATGLKIYSLEKLSLIEIRETLTDNSRGGNSSAPVSSTLTIPFTAPNSNLGTIIDLGYDYETLGGDAYNTTINSVFSGFETRRSNWVNAKGSYDVGQRTLVRSELNQLIALFRICRGQFTRFFYKDWKDNDFKVVRFGEDSISFVFKAINRTTKEVIFDLSGVALIRVSAIPTDSYLIPLFDTSGSMGDSIPFIEQALEDLRPLLKQAVYLTDEATNKYFLQPSNFGDERYLKRMAQDYRYSELDRKRFIFLIFENEANPVYHGTTRNLNNEPTETYLTDLADFQEAYADIEFFKALIVIPVPDPIEQRIESFIGQVSDAIGGTNGYTPLSQYNVSKEVLPDDTTASVYLGLLLTYLQL